MTNVELSRTNGDTTLHVLRKVDFTAESGQLHMLVGPNGCGKVRYHVTLVKLLACCAWELLQGSIRTAGFGIAPLPSKRRQTHEKLLMPKPLIR
jgi:ABC-type branched-subunit amino acid transport system ATPase component